jgi:hypothetical protein
LSRSNSRKMSKINLKKLKIWWTAKQKRKQI